jgi:putative peptidoglycan lipid II flippase
VTDVEIDGLPADRQGHRRRLAGATAGMAVGTTLSRITGLVSVIILASALGGGGFADAYNLANTTPNIVTDIVIGGVLSATFVPVFVDRLSTRSSDEAWEAISAVVTVTVVVLFVATIAFFFLAPEIIGVYTAANHNPDVTHQRAEAVFFLRWFVPQLTCYGLIALFTALLNTRGKFAAPMFVPIANNLVLIVVLLWFHELVPHPSLATVDTHHSALVLLAAGTTLGVAVQTVLLAPSLVRARLHVHFLWRPAHEAMRTIARLSGWTFGWVLANQIALVIILALADGVKVPGAVSAYTYAYRFFQLPYGIVAVSIMTAVTPSLASRWALRDTFGFRHRMAFGLRGILAIIIPSAVGMLLLAHPLIDLVLQHGAETSASASITGATLAMFALGLPGFCTFLYIVRILQAMQDTRTAFYLYLVENGLNIVFGVTLVGPLGVRGLALSLSLAYTVSAVLGLALIRNRVGGLGGDDLTTPVKHVLAATAVMAVLTVLALNVSGSTTGFGLFARVVLAVVVGIGGFVATAGLLAHRGDPGSPPDRSGQWAALDNPTSDPVDGSVDGSASQSEGNPDDDQADDLSDDSTDLDESTDLDLTNGSSSEPIHDRLDERSTGAPDLSLHAVSEEPEDDVPPGGGIDGPYTGGDR